MITTDLGAVTAYAEAVAQGYTGTKEEFGKMLANYMKTAEKVAEDKVVAEQAMESAKASADRASTSEQNAKASEDAILQKLADTKTEVDASVEAGKKLKTDLDKSIADSTKSKTALDESIKSANSSKTALGETVEQANALDTSLGSNIAEGTQLNKDITASGQKAVSDINSASTKALEDINTAGAAKLDAVNKAAEAIVADREQIAKNKTDITALNEDLAQIENTVVGKNLLNPDTVTIGKRMYIDGSVHTQESDFYTDFIAVKPNQHIYASFLNDTGNFVRSQIRHTCAYDASKNALPSKGQSDIGYDYLVPDGVAYIVVTFTENNNINHRQLEVSDTGKTSFEEYFAPYTELKVQAQIDKNASGVKRLNEEKANGKGISFSINESGGLRVTYDDGK